MKDLRDGIRQKTLPNLTVKYDGSPSIVVGHFLSGRPGWFVGTKSIFNSEPIFYTSYTAIASDDRLNQNLKDILLEAAYALGDSDFVVEPMQGDVLWSVHEDAPTNILNYNFVIQSQTRLVVAWHSFYRGEPGSLELLQRQPLYDEADVLPGVACAQIRLNCENLPIIPNFNCDFGEISFPLIPPGLETIVKRAFVGRNFLDRHMMLHAIKMELELSKTKRLAKLKTSISMERVKAIAKELEATASWQSEELFKTYRNYQEVVAIKEYLINVLEYGAPIPAYYGDTPVKQEGYVYKKDGLIVKLVDRNQFTQFNKNSPHAK